MPGVLFDFFFKKVERKIPTDLIPSVKTNLKELSANPHHLGSTGSKTVAESVLKKFKDYGWEARIETYYVLFQEYLGVIY